MGIILCMNASSGITPEVQRELDWLKDEIVFRRRMWEWERKTLEERIDWLEGRTWRRSSAPGTGGAFSRERWFTTYFPVIFTLEVVAICGLILFGGSR